jgi:hypothetical protein
MAVERRREELPRAHRFLSKLNAALRVLILEREKLHEVLCPALTRLDRFSCGPARRERIGQLVVL